MKKSIIALIALAILCIAGQALATSLTVSVSEDIDPDCGGTYTLEGQYNGFPYYVSDNDEWVLWHDVYQWIISRGKEDYSAYWIGGATCMFGNYGNAGEESSGTATVNPQDVPDKAIIDYPDNDATGVCITGSTLFWEAGCGATSHDVYFGTNPAPGENEFKGTQTATTYDPGTLAYNTTYYWRIDAKNTYGMSTGDVWSFTSQTVPDKAIIGSPDNAATEVYTTGLTLFWYAGCGGATSHDVYFGTNPAPGTNEFKGNQTATTYDPGTLTNNTTYYWRIDTKNTYGTTTGDVWNFTTIYERDVTYVATDGSDANDGSSWGEAYLTIQKALDHTADGGTLHVAAGIYNYEALHSLRLTSTQNGKTITVDGGDANTTILSSSASDALRITTMSTGVITFQNMTFKSTYAGNRDIVDWSANTDGGQITFNNCVLGVPSDSITGGTGVVYMGGLTASPPTRKLSLKNTRCYGKDNVETLFIGDINSLLIENCIIDGNNATTGSSALTLSWEIGDVNITGSVIHSKAKGLDSFYIIPPFGSCHIDNTVFDTGRNAITITESLQSGTFTNINSNGGIWLGQGASANPNPLGTCLIKDCNFTYDSRSSASTGMSIGYGCNGITVENCRFIGFKTGLNAKTIGSNFIDCVFTGGPSGSGDYSAIYLRATKDCNFTNVTAYSKYQYALWTSFGVVEEADANTNRNKFTNCIFDASGGGVYAHYNSGANDANGNIFNYNCYKAGSYGLFFLKGLKDFGQWKAYWAANGSSALAKSNDINSINADPCFTDAAGGDFSLKSGSLCLDSAQPVVGQENLVTYYTCDDDDTNPTILDTGRRNIGAWNPDGTTVRDTCDMHVAGIIGGALSFDGNDYVDCDNTYKSNSLTLSIWVKPNDGQPSDSQVIFSKRVDDGNHFEIYLNTSGLFDANCVVQGVSKTVTLYQNAKSVSALDDGDSNWIMLTAVVSDCNISGTGNLLIGSSFWGSIDDVRIYNKALSANEVETLYKEVYLIKLAGDLNGDYRVDFFDFALMAGTYDGNTEDWLIIKDIADTWLNCGLSNQDNCWQ